MTKHFLLFGTYPSPTFRVVVWGAPTSEPAPGSVKGERGQSISTTTEFAARNSVSVCGCFGSYLFGKSQFAKDLFCMLAEKRRRLAVGQWSLFENHRRCDQG